MRDGVALQLRDCLNEMLELEEGGGLHRVNVTRRADDASEETREIACVGDIVGNLVPRFNTCRTLEFAPAFGQHPVWCQSPGADPDFGGPPICRARHA